MFSAMSNMASGVADMLGGEQFKPMNQAKEALTTMEDSLNKPLEQVSRVEDMINAGIPMDAVESAKQQFTSLTTGVTDMVNGDGKKLLPPGGACIAGCYIKSIKGKLKKIMKEVDKLMAKVNEMPVKAMTELEELKTVINSVTMNFKGVGGIIKDSVSQIEGVVSDMSKLQDLESELNSLEEKLKGAISGARGAVANLTGTIAHKPGAIMKLIKDLVAEIDTFMMRTPKSVVKAFKPPMCCCCIGGKAGDAQQQIESSLDAVSNAISLQPVVDGLNSLFQTLELLDLSSATGALDTVEGQFGEVLKPVKEAVAQMNSLRGAGAGDAPPEA
mmetsp:Transcript_68357/g.154775  ORF Transcript_68357/g.154775 Transcript_68357/m.154775 type:complete len:330 (-) Transcript_68357:108-1097(-)